MASYKDFTSLNEDSLTEQQLRQGITTMASAANKRLRRMEAARVPYGHTQGEDTISGVRRFTTRGKTDITDLRNEYKRVKEFLNEPQSSLSGMWKAYKTTERSFSTYDRNIRKVAGRRKRLTKKNIKDEAKRLKQQNTYGNEGYYQNLDERNTLTRYEKIRAWRDLWDVYNYLRESGYYNNQFAHDSNQVRELIYTITSEGVDKGYDFDRMVSEARQLLDNDYIESKKQEIEQRERDISTSSLVNLGGSD